LAGPASPPDVRTAFFGAAGNETPVVAVDCEGLRFLVSTQDPGLGKRLFAKGTRNDMKLLARVMARLDDAGLGRNARRGVFLDVGANIGTACLVAVTVHGFQRALALEPEPGNFALLRANAALNLLDDRIDSRRLAASAGAGHVELALTPVNSGSHQVRRAKRGQQSIQVDAVALDGLLEEEGLVAGDVGLVWIDVNGHELEVLRGAKTLLAGTVPLVLEVRRRTESLEQLLGVYGYVADLRSDGPSLPIREVGGMMASLEAREKGGRRHTDLLLLPERRSGATASPKTHERAGVRG
jgi:FkbM family methyltransferase